MTTAPDRISRFRHMQTTLRSQAIRFIAAQDGVASLEYGLIASGISAAGIAAIMGMGESLSSKLDVISEALSDMPARLGPPLH